MSAASRVGSPVGTSPPPAAGHRRSRSMALQRHAAVESSLQLHAPGSARTDDALVASAARAASPPLLSSHATSSHTATMQLHQANIAHHQERILRVARPIVMPSATGPPRPTPDRGDSPSPAPSTGTGLLGLHPTRSVSRSPSTSHRSVHSTHTMSGVATAVAGGIHLRHRSHPMSVSPPGGGPAAAADSPVQSQSRSTSRLRRIQQQLSKLTAADEIDGAGPDAPPADVPRQQAGVGVGASTLHPSSAISSDARLFDSHVTSSTGTGSSDESRSAVDRLAQQRKDALIQHYVQQGGKDKKSSADAPTDGVTSDAPKPLSVAVAPVHPPSSADRSPTPVSGPISPPPPMLHATTRSTPSSSHDLLNLRSLRNASRLKKSLLAFGVLSLILVAVTFILCYWQLSQIGSSVDEFMYSEDISNYTSSLLESLLDGETGTRGYQITGLVEYLQPYNDSLVSVPYYYELLRAVSDARQGDLVFIQLSALIANISSQWATTIEDRSVPVIGFELSRNDTITLGGKETMDNIRELLSGLRVSESDVVARKYSDTHSSLLFMRIVMGVSLSLIALTVCVGGWLGIDVESRRLQQHNQQLATLLTKAEEATRLKSVFLASISHEIRTPMNGVLAMTRYLCSMELNPEQQEVVDTVLTCSESMMRLIDDLLLFSKMEAGKFRLCPVNFVLSALLMPISEMFAIRCASKGARTRDDNDAVDPAADDASEPQTPLVQWNMMMDENLPHKIYADNDRLRQILTNLCDNAVKFTRSGSVTLKVSLINPHSTRHRAHANSGGSFGGGASADRLSQRGGAASEQLTLSRHRQSSVGLPQRRADGTPGWKERPANANDAAATPPHVSSHGPRADAPLASQADANVTAAAGDSAAGRPLTFFQRMLGPSGLSQSNQAKQSHTPSKTSADAEMVRLHISEGSTFAAASSDDRARLATKGGTPPMPGTAESTMPHSSKAPSRGVRDPPLPHSHLPTQYVYLRFSVSDTGIGVDPSVHKAIFEPFQQADMSTTRHFGGTGLGLSICSQLVAQMGGRLKIQSTAGAGATFYFTLKCPIVYDQAEDEFDEEDEEDSQEDGEAHDFFEGDVGAHDPETARRDLANQPPIAGHPSPNSASSDEVRVVFHQSPIEHEFVQTFVLPATASSESLTSAVAPTIIITTPAEVDLEVHSNHTHHTTTSFADASECAGLPTATTSSSPSIADLAAGVSSQSPADVEDAFVAGRVTRTALLSPRRKLATERTTIDSASEPQDRTPTHATPASDSSQGVHPSPSSIVSVTTDAVSSPAELLSQPPGSSPNDSLTSPAPIAASSATDGTSPAPALTAVIRRTTDQPSSKRTRKNTLAGSGSGSLPKDATPPLHILIAEDNAINVKVLTKLLTHDGHTVVVANNGKEAVDIYQAQPNGFQIILMDLHMPVMDGLEATTTIRAVEKEWDRLAESPHRSSATTSPMPVDAAALSVRTSGGSSGGSSGGDSGRFTALLAHATSAQTKLPPGLPKQPKSPAVQRELTSEHTASAHAGDALAHPAPSHVSISVSRSDHSALGHSSSDGSTLSSAVQAANAQVGTGAGSRASMRKVHIPIIAVTASALDSDAETCKAAGMDDVLTKPVSIVDLRAKLKAVSLRWQHMQKAARQVQKHVQATSATHATEEAQDNATLLAHGPMGTPAESASSPAPSLPADADGSPPASDVTQGGPGGSTPADRS